MQCLDGQNELLGFERGGCGGLLQSACMPPHSLPVWFVLTLPFVPVCVGCAAFVTWPKVSCRSYEEFTVHREEDECVLICTFAAISDLLRCCMRTPPAQ